MTTHVKSLFDRRRARVRGRIARSASTRPRLSVFRSSKHIYVQIIDDAAGRTVATASSIDGELRKDGGLKSGTDTEAATAVGKLIASRALAAGVKSVVFDRGGYRFHGRVKALADAAREGGLDF
jgi:large subunit ribosomal protein L18